MLKPTIAITIGDPAGIGPEIIFRAINSSQIRKICSPVVFGDKNVISKYVDITSTRYSFVFTSQYKNKIILGKPSKVSGLIAYNAIEQATKMAIQHKVDAVVTAPVSKESFKLANLKYYAHTELLANLTNTKKYCMMMVCENINSVMVTRHLAIKDISAKITKKEIIDTVKVSSNFIKNLIKKNPKIILCALNPHCGDNGLLGNEEKKILVPAVKQLQQQKYNILGPLPSDMAWIKARNNECDLIVSMYHDQVMIPLKVIAQNKIINVTAGLSIIRTSPGHGTAFDIAGKNKADATSMIEAIKYATKLAKSK